MLTCRAATVTAALAVALTASCGHEHSPATPAAGRNDTAAPPTSRPATFAFKASRTYDTFALPVRIRIPDIGVDSGLERLSRQPDGTIGLPSWNAAGWYQQGPRPGEPGPAVILGHVDSRTGPAVFYRLSALTPEDAIIVTRADGTEARFRVVRLVRVAKAEFPTDLVYLPTLDRELRLVTCGGSFDTSTGHYRDNLIVFATETDQ